MNNLLLIDSRIDDIEYLIKSLNTSTKHIIFDYYNDTIETIKDSITNLNINNFSSIGIIQHNYNFADYKLLDSLSYSYFDDINSWNIYVNFINYLKKYSIQNFDFLACSLYSDPKWAFILDNIQTITNINIRASTDKTGSGIFDSNWFLETDSINIKPIYFNDNIDNYTGVFFYTYSQEYTRKTYYTKSIPSSVIVFGDSSAGGDYTTHYPAETFPTNIHAIYTSNRAFTALTPTGKVFTWGDTTNGGTYSTIYPSGYSLASNIVDISCGLHSFSALKNDGTVACWGNFLADGGGTTLIQPTGYTDIIKIFPNYYSYAGLKKDGTVVCWGGSNSGGSTSSLTPSGATLTNIATITSTYWGFAALKTDATAICWGSVTNSAISFSLSSVVTNVSKISASSGSFSALKNDGTVFSWGRIRFDSATAIVSPTYDVVSNAIEIYANIGAYAVLRSDGSVFVWGDSGYGGNPADVAGLINVKTIYNNQWGFVALRNDGSLYVWGTAAYGHATSNGAGYTGIPSVLTIAGANVIHISVGGYSYSALTSNGTVFNWGSTTNGGSVGGQVSGLTNVVNIVSNYDNSHIAMKSDGSLTVVGSGLSAPSTVTNANSNVITVYGNAYTYATLINSLASINISYQRAIDKFNFVRSAENRRRMNLSSFNNVLQISDVYDLYQINYTIPQAIYHILVPIVLSGSTLLTSSTVTIPSNSNDIGKNFIIACDESENIVINSVTYRNYGSYVYRVESDNTYTKVTSVTINSNKYDVYGGNGTIYSGIILKFSRGYIIGPNSDLTNADLSYTDLSNVNLTNANLTNANLSNTNINNTIFTGATLTGVKTGNVFGTPTLPANYFMNSFNNVTSPTYSLVNQVNVGTFPLFMTISYDGYYAYVCNYNSNTISVIDLKTYTVNNTINVGAAPVQPAINKAGTLLYVPLTTDNTVQIVDLKIHQVIKTINVGTAPFSVTLNSTETVAYVTNPNSNNISSINLSTYVVTNFSAGNSPRELVIDSTGTFALVANSGANTVTRFTLSNNTVTNTYSFSGSVRGLAINSTNTTAYVVINGSNEVRSINLTTGATALVCSTSANPISIRISASNNYAFVSNEIGDNMTVIKLSDNTTTTVSIGDGPQGLEISPFGDFIYILTYNENKIKIFSGDTVRTGYIIGPNVNLSNTNLGNINLTGKDISGTNLDNTDLSLATLTNLKSGSITGTPILPNNFSVVKGYIIGSNVDLTSATLTNINYAKVAYSAFDDFISGPTAQTTSNDWQYFEVNTDRSTATLLLDWQNGTEVIPNYGQWDNNRSFSKYPAVQKIPDSGVIQSGYGTSFIGPALVMHTDDSNTYNVGIGYKNNTGGTIYVSIDLTLSLLFPTNNTDGVNYYIQRGLINDARYKNYISSNIPTASTSNFTFNKKNIELQSGEIIYLILNRNGVYNWDHTRVVFNVNINNCKSLTFNNINLTSANFSGTNCTAATFTNCNVTNTNFQTATLTSLNSSGLTGTPLLPAGYSVVNNSISGPDITSNLENADLTGMNLSNLNLNGVNLSNSILTNITSGGITGTPTLPANYLLIDGYIIGPNVNLTNATLSSSNLTNANLSGVNLTGTNLSSATLTGLKSGSITNSTGISLPSGYTIISGYIIGPNVNLTSAALTSANLSNKNLSGVNLTSAVLTSATLTGVSSGSITATVAPTLPTNYTLVNGYIIGPSVNLTSVNLSNQNLTNANLNGATLTNTNLTGATLTGLVSGSLTSISGLTLSASYNVIGGYIVGPNVNLSSVNFGTNSLAGKDLSGINFTNANLSNTNLANIKSGSITGTGLTLPTNYNFQSGYIIGPNVDLTSATLNNFNLTNYIINGANLTNANLTGATLTNLSSSYVNLTGTTLPTNYGPYSTINNALNFVAASSNYIQTNQTNIVDLNKASFTIECWINTTGINCSIVTLSTIGVNWTTGNKVFYINGTGKPEFVGYGNSWIKSTKVVNDGTWHHIAVVWAYSSGTNGTGYMYVDGIDVTDTGNLNPYVANNNNVGTFMIGYPISHVDSNNYFNGSIDEVRLWQMVRTVSQINTYMYSELTGNEKNLKAYYSFNIGNASGNNIGLTTLYDKTPNAYNGTLTNFTLSGATSNYVTRGSFNYIIGPNINLSGATLNNIDLTNANLSGVNVFNTNFNTNNFNNVKSGNMLGAPIFNGASVVNGLNFDGVNDTIVISSYPSLNVSSHTIECWINPSQYSYSFPILINNNGGIKLESNGTISGEYNAGGYYTVQSNYILPLNTWTHIAFVRNDSGNNKIYINGVLDKTTTNNGTTVASASGLSIGANAIANDSYFKGSLSELRIWSGVRTGAEIKRYYNNRLLGNETNLTAYYKFNHGTASSNNAGITTLRDYSPNNYNGTLNNFALSGATSNWIAGPTLNGSYALVSGSDGSISRNALYFDGANDNVVMNSYPLLNTNQQTLEAWIYLTSYNNPTTVTICLNNNGGLNVDSTGKINVWFSTTTSGWTNIVSDTTVPLNVWTYIAFVKNDNGYNKLYINNNVVKNTVDTTGTFNNNVGMSLGANVQGGGTDVTVLRLSEVRIWSIARTENQIKTYYNNSLTGLEYGLEAYYKFDHGSAGNNNAGITTLTDYSQNGYHGVLNNFALSGSTSNWVAGPTLSGSLYIVGPYVDLTSGNLTNVDLTNKDLYGVNLTNTNLTNANFTNVSSGGITSVGTTFSANYSVIDGYIIGPNVNLTDANLSSSNLSNKNISGANISYANLTSTTLTGLSSGTLTAIGVSLPNNYSVISGYIIGPNVNLTSAALTSANLSNKDLSGVTLSSAVLTSANLSGVKSGSITASPAPTFSSGYAIYSGYIIGPNVDLTSANLSSANLTNANISGVTLTSTNLSSATLSGVKSGSITNITGLTLPANYFIIDGYLIGPSVDLTSATLTNSNLTNKILTGANITSANLGSATLSGLVSGSLTSTGVTLPANYSVISGFIIGPNVDLSSANLSSANLTNANISGVTLTSTNLSSATLSGVKSGSITNVTGLTLPTNYFIIDGYLIGPSVDLSSATLTNSNLTNKILTGANITNANLGSATLSGLVSGSLTSTGVTLPANYSVVSGFIIGPSVDLSSANLSNYDLTNKVLTGVNLTSTNLTGAILDGVVSGTITATTNPTLPTNYSLISGFIIGPRVNLSSSNLGSVNLSSSNLTSANLTSATLTSTNLTSTNLINANLTSCNLSSANLTTVKTSFSSITDAIISRTTPATYTTDAVTPVTSNLTSRRFQYVSVSRTGQYQVASEVFSGYTYTSNDYGVSWIQRQANGNIDRRWINISLDGKYILFTSPLNGLYINSNYGIGANTRVVNLTVNSANDTATSSVNWQVCAVSPTGKYMYAGTHINGYIYLSSNYGAEGSWNAIKTYTGGTIPVSNSIYWLTQPAFSEDETIHYIAGSGDYLYKSVDSGATWSRLTSLGLKDFRGIATSSTGQYISVTVYNSYIYISNDYGATWTTRVTDAGRNWGDILMIKDGSFQIASGIGFFPFYSFDYGNNWTQMTTSHFNNLSAANILFWNFGLSYDNGEYITFANDGSGSDNGTGLIHRFKLTQLKAGITGTPTLPSGYYLKNRYILGQGITLQNADLSGISLTSADITGMNLSYSSLFGATLTTVNMSNVNLSNSNLLNSDLSNSTLSNTNLTNTNLLGTTLSGLISNNVTIFNTTLPTNYNARNGYIIGPSVNMSGLNLTNGLYGELNFSNVNLSNTNLTSTSFNNSNLSNAILTNANLTSANLMKTNFTGVDLSSATLTTIKTSYSNINDLLSSRIKLSTYTTDDAVPVTGTFTSPSGGRCFISTTGQHQSFMIAGTNIPGLYTSNDYGVTWVRRMATISLNGVDTYAMSSNGQYYLIVVWGSAASGLYVNNNYGIGAFTKINNVTVNSANDTATSSIAWFSASVSPSGRYMCAGSFGTGYYYISNNFGIAGSWSALKTYVGGSFPNSGYYSSSAICYSEDETIQYLSIRYVEYIYKSTDSGVTWNRLTNSGARGWNKLACSSNGQYIVAGTWGEGLYMSSDYGATWAQKLTYGSNTWQSVAISGDGKMVFGCLGWDQTNGDYPHISIDYGNTWTRTDSAFYGGLDGNYAMLNVAISRNNSNYVLFSNYEASGRTGSGFTYRYKLSDMLGGIVGVPTLPSGYLLANQYILGQGLVLRNSDLSNSTVNNFNMTNMDLTSSNLSGITLSTVNLTGVNMTSVNLTNAIITSPTISAGTNMSTITISGTKIVSVTGSTTLPATYAFVSNNLLGPNVNLTNVNLSGLTISNNLSGSDLSNANLSNANLTSSNITSVNFTGATLTGIISGSITATSNPTLPTNYILSGGFIFGPSVNLSSKNLSGVNLSNSILTGSNLSSITVNATTNMTGVTFTNVTSGSISGTTALITTDYSITSGYIVGPNVDLSSGALTSSNLSNKNLSGVNFTNAVLSSANLSGVTINNSTNFTGATFTNITSGSITGTTTNLPANITLTSGYFIGPSVNLTGASLTGINLSSRTLTATNFTNAVLTNGNLSGITIDNTTNFTGATFTNITSGNITGTTTNFSSNYILISGFIVGPNVNLTSANLSSANLSNRDLSSTNLTNANINGITVNASTNFSSTTLTGLVSGSITGTTTNFPVAYTIINGYVVGPSVNLSNGALTNANMTNKNISGVNLLNAVLTGATLTGVTIDASTNLTGTTLTNVLSGNVSGTTANLPVNYSITSGYIIGPSVNLTNATLSGLNLNSRVLSGVNFTGANLTNGDLSGITIDNTTNFTGATFTNITSGSISGSTANFSPNYNLISGFIVGPNVNLTSANLSSQNLTNKNISGTNLTSANLTGATLTGLISGSITASTPPTLSADYTLITGYIVGPNVNLTSANLSNQNLTNKNMSGTNLTSANLSGTTLSGVISGNVIGSPTLPTDYSMILGYIVGPSVNLVSANLANGNLSSKNLTDVNLSSSDLTNATITSANFTNTNILSATITGLTFSNVQKVQLLKNNNNRNINAIQLNDITGSDVISMIPSSTLSTIVNVASVTFKVVPIGPGNTVDLSAVASTGFYVPTTTNEAITVGEKVLYSDGNNVIDQTTGQPILVLNYGNKLFKLYSGSVIGIELNLDTYKIYGIGFSNIFETKGNASEFNNSVTAKQNITVNGTSTLTGNVGIGQAPSVTYKVDVLGSVRSSLFTTTSDYRIKDDVMDINNTVDDLRPVRYYNKLNNKREYGFIAHEMQQVIPEIVDGDKDGEEYQSIAYTSLIAILVKEIKGLKDEIRELKNKN